MSDRWWSIIETVFIAVTTVTLVWCIVVVTARATTEPTDLAPKVVAPACQAK